MHTCKFGFFGMKCYFLMAQITCNLLLSKIKNNKLVVAHPWSGYPPTVSILNWKGKPFWKREPVTKGKSQQKLNSHNHSDGSWIQRGSCCECHTVYIPLAIFSRQQNYVLVANLPNVIYNIPFYFLDKSRAYFNFSSSCYFKQMQLCSKACRHITILAVHRLQGITARSL